ncbi:hypothetical protein SH668x_003268 [Planctomicrobium sp. SH668]|uniref:hypothetical protein n=1 Tax=Planctomicrobium sp. SH668 TaxID=3448126 RepID=UPI003F5C0BCB
MLRKLIIGAAIAATIGGVVIGRDFCSYARTGVKTARDHLRKEVPLEFEIERARHEVERLIPEVRRSVHLIATEQVEVAQLTKSIATREKALATQQDAILAMKNDLKSQDLQYVYAGHKYSRNDVEKDLSERFNRFKIAEDTVKREQQVLAAKEKALAANRETLEGMLNQKKNLEAELERLDARMRTIAARKQIHGIEIDDSQLTRVKGLIANIEKRLDVEDAVLASEGDLNGLIPVEQAQEEELGDIAAQIDEYFGTNEVTQMAQKSDPTE